ncbi:MAG: methionine biosynthesis protein MetW, partial [Rhodospirillaceae bacterium]|nr:methionine biosynthesis protein MetW [Rhodospirillaceae bacterium]
IHFCTIKDFVALCVKLNINIESGIALNRRGFERQIGGKGLRFANLRGEQAIFLLKRQ